VQRTYELPVIVLKQAVPDLMKNKNKPLEERALLYKNNQSGICC